MLSYSSFELKALRPLMSQTPMKLALCSTFALVLLSLPLNAQSPPTDEKLKGAVETLRQLNKAPAPVAADTGGLRTRGAKAPSAPDPALIKELGVLSLEFLKKHAAGVGHVIYGEDNRRSFDNATAAQKRAAEATAVLVFADQVQTDRPGTVRLVAKPGPRFCSPGDVRAGHAPAPEPFWDQVRPGFCSGFKVGHDLIATAGHCVNATNCSNVRVVFGFRNTNPRYPADRDIPEANVYACKEVVAGAFAKDDPEDWRIIRVERSINAPQVTLRMEGLPAKDTPLTVVGHPSGLPVTIADGATVRRLEAKTFVADLDTYGGNSGSPVFNSDRLRAGDLFAEGILVRGEKDFVQFQPCMLSKRCPVFEWCGGESVTYASLLEPALRKITRTEAKK